MTEAVAKAIGSALAGLVLGWSANALTQSGRVTALETVFVRIAALEAGYARIAALEASFGRVEAKLDRVLIADQQQQKAKP